MKEEKGRLLSELEDALLIDKHDLDRALIQHPDLSYRVETHLNMLISNRDYESKRLKEVQAEIRLAARKDARRSDEKVTDKDIDALIDSDKKAMKTEDDLLAIKAQIGKWSALLHAYQQRSYALSHLVELYVKNYYQPDGSSKAETKRQYSDDQHMNRRESMNRERVRARPGDGT